MQETREKILEVAEDLIQRVGVNAMSYHHISEAVGIRKASVHHHFPKKENLVEELLKRCNSTYGAQYQLIVDEGGAAPDKLRKLADVFLNGLKENKLCVIGSISTDKNTLQDGSCKILERSIQETVAIFAAVFREGREEKSLSYSGTDTEAAYAFFSFLVGTQIVGRSQGGIEMFSKAAEFVIAALET